MSTTVPVSFVEQYEAEVKHVYQREGSKLRGTVRTRNQVGAKRIYFPILGKGKATKKSRHADVVPMDLEHTRAEADMEDFYAPEYVDDLDQAKTNWSIASEYARSSGWALGRQTDEILFDAMGETSNEVSITTVNDNGGELTLKSIAEGMWKNMAQNDVPMDGRLYAVMNPKTMAELFQITEATSTDFVTQQLLESGAEPPMYMGFRWMTHTGVPEDIRGFFYHTTAVGHGISRDIQTSIDWIPQKVSTLVNSWMSMGATIVDEDGVFKLVD